LIALLAAVCLTAVGIIASSPTSAHAADLYELESNNSLGTANELPLSTTITGWTYITGSQYDHDVYHFPNAQDSRVRFTLTFPAGLPGDAYYIRIYDTDGQQRYAFDVAGTGSNGTWANAYATYLPAGGGYIDISGSNADKTWGKEYKLTVGRVLTTATPKIAGTAKVGRTLTAKPGTWGPKGTKLHYQWYRSGKAIKGATGKTHKATAADAGRKLTVKVTGTRSGYLSASKTSASRVVGKA